LFLFNLPITAMGS